jgi:hypothetical protein
MLLTFNGKNKKQTLPSVMVAASEIKPVITKQHSAWPIHLIGPKSLRYFEFQDRKVILLGDRHDTMEFSCGASCTSCNLAKYRQHLDRLNTGCDNYINAGEKAPYEKELASLSQEPRNPLECVFVTDWLMQIAMKSPECVDVFIEHSPDNQAILGKSNNYLDAVRNTFCGCLKASRVSTYNAATKCYELFPSLRLHMVDIRNDFFEDTDSVPLKARMTWLLHFITKLDILPPYNYDTEMGTYIQTLQKLFSKSLFATDPAAFIAAWQMTISQLMDTRGVKYIVTNTTFTFNLFIFDLYASLRMCVRKWTSRDTVLDSIPRVRTMGARCRDQTFPRQIILYAGERHIEAIAAFFTNMFGNQPLDEQSTDEKCILLDNTILPPFCFL